MLYKGQRRSLISFEFRDASLPRFELGSGGVELRALVLAAVNFEGISGSSVLFVIMN
jgi:hypothetical protein